MKQASYRRAGDGPVVVIAAAGTGKTRVIVERVKCLLDNREDLLPESVLVLTYNVKAAGATRADQERIGARAARPCPTSTTSVTASSPECGRCRGARQPGCARRCRPVAPAADLRPELSSSTTDRLGLPEFVKLINRAKDELVTPADFEAFVAGSGDLRRALRQLRRGGRPTRDPGQPRRPCATCEASTRACAERARGGARRGARRRPGRAEKTADREARRTSAGPAVRPAGANTPTTSSRRSMRSPTPTSRTAPRWRSCACTRSQRSTGRTRRNWSIAARSISVSRSRR